MAAKVREGKARWEGNLARGSGTLSTGSGAVESTYSAASRFEDGEGTNPDELIAAAHAGCFSMALSLVLGQAGNEPEWIEATAKVTIAEADGGGFEIPTIELVTRASVPGISAADFAEHATAAKDGCPVSKALAGPEISLEASLA